MATRLDGTHVGCIADGVGGAGFFSAFVAHRISHYVMNRLSEGSIGFGKEEAINKKIVRGLFQDSFNDLQSLQNDDFIGSSTILFAECVPTNQNRVYRLCVGALGDGAVIYIDNKTKKALQLNTIHRGFDESGKPNITSSGGQIHIRYGVMAPQNIEAKIIEIDEDDYVVLVTDGFLDNVRDGRISDMVELVAYNPFFDQSLLQLFGYSRFWEEDRPRLPTVEEMTMFIDVNETSIMNEETELTAEKITKRLAAYTALVTHSFQIKEEDCYMDMGDYPSRYDDSPKTDDAMIIVMSPIAGKR